MAEKKAAPEGIDQGKIAKEAGDLAKGTPPAMDQPGNVETQPVETQPDPAIKQPEPKPTQPAPVETIPQGQAEAKQHAALVKEFGPDYVIAEKKGIKTTFSATSWDRLGKNKEGWKQVVKTPPEVQNLKAKQSQNA